MSFLLGGLSKITNTPLFPGVPNSNIGDPFGMGKLLGLPPSDKFIGGMLGLGGDAIGGAKDAVKGISSTLPYIMIGGGTLVLIILLKR